MDVIARRRFGGKLSLRWWLSQKSIWFIGRSDSRSNLVSSPRVHLVHGQTDWRWLVPFLSAGGIFMFYHDMDITNFKLVVLCYQFFFGSSTPPRLWYQDLECHVNDEVTRNLWKRLTWETSSKWCTLRMMVTPVKLACYTGWSRRLFIVQLLLIRFWLASLSAKSFFYRLDQI